MAEGESPAADKTRTLRDTIAEIVGEPVRKNKEHSAFPGGVFLQYREKLPCYGFLCCSEVYGKIQVLFMAVVLRNFRRF